MGAQPRIRRVAPGEYEVKIPAAHRELLRQLPGQLRSIIHSDHPGLRRFFPPAYPDDPVRAAEYDAMVREELVAGRKRSLEIMERTIDADRLDAELMAAWLSALNDLRLFLGTSLDVTEETYEQPIREDDPNSQALAIYSYLGWLEEQAIDALAGDLEEPVEPDRR
jgi:uncharacterized protein DUF2017